MLGESVQAHPVRLYALALAPCPMRLCRSKALVNRDTRTTLGQENGRENPALPCSILRLGVGLVPCGLGAALEKAVDKGCQRQSGGFAQLCSLWILRYMLPAQPGPQLGSPHDSGPLPCRLV